ncbi:GNAT family N-acetyltransferase [Pseudomonas sp. SDI]|uniref:GNAT family N-acetyltransferase n=1 Tax=Pseudomonas sp. SDI TaxID=2170734 RepID=UPI000DE7969E|nr:GNAT family N-acetyltransferase [Pseudomonas sp. SDI]PWB32901.1 GNAT family N-acetyltransferase [Pseudomonas sp. SDI]
MRASANAELWVARAPGIVAALNLSAVAEGYWLTGLLVDPTRRSQRLAHRLIAQACSGKAGTVWLFCHPELAGFYQQQGFTGVDSLPAALAERLARYQRSKPLIALGRAQSSVLGSSPGNSTSV